MTKTQAHTNAVLRDVLFQLDPIQKTALRNRDAGMPLALTSDDPSKPITFVAECIAEALAAEHTLCIRIEDEAQLRQLGNLLKETHLAHFVLLDGLPMATDFFAHILLSKNKPLSPEALDRQRIPFRAYEMRQADLKAKLGLSVKPVFGDHSWSQVLARVLALPKREEKAVLSARIDASDFEWAPKEYWMLRGRIESFNKLSELRSTTVQGLDKLNLEVFSGKGVDDMKSSLTGMLADLRKQGTEILLGYAAVIANYKDTRQDNYLEKVSEAQQKVKQLEQRFMQASMLFGEIFVHESSYSSLSHQIRKQFSKITKDMVLARSELKREYLALTDSLRSEDLSQLIPDWTLPDLLTMENIKEDLKRVKKALAKSELRIQHLLKEQQKRLNAYNIGQDHPLAEKISGHERAIEAFINRVNTSGLFRMKHEVNALSLTRKSKVVEDILLICREVEESLGQLEEFLFWNSFWNALPPHVQSLLRTLELFSAEQRLEIFDSWYMSQLLQSIHKSAFVREDEITGQFKRLRQDMVPVAIDFIRQVQQVRRGKYFLQIPQEEKHVLKSLSKQDQQAFLAQFELLSGISKRKLFPVEILTREPLKPQLSGFVHYIELRSKETDTIMEVACYKPGEQMDEHAMSTFHLGVSTCPPDFKWSALNLSMRLQKLRALSTQFLPVSRDLSIYHTQKMQVFSFLGDTIDRELFKALDTPYKQPPADSENLLEQITESMLDPKKPILVLCRDGVLGHQQDPDTTWSMDTLELFEKVGLHVLMTWSGDWAASPGSTIEKIAENIRAIVNGDQDADDQREPDNPTRVAYAES